MWLYFMSSYIIEIRENFLNWDVGWNESAALYLRIAPHEDISQEHLDARLKAWMSLKCFQEWIGIKARSVMHLSVVSPTLPLPGRPCIHSREHGELVCFFVAQGSGFWSCSDAVIQHSHIWVLGMVWGYCHFHCAPYAGEWTFPIYQSPHQEMGGPRG